MNREFPWVPDVSRGEWIAERLGDAERGESDALSGAIPHGFDALVRVLHPFSRDRLVTGTWAELIEQQEADPHTPIPESVDETGVTWQTVANVHALAGSSTALRPDALSHTLLGLDYGEHRDTESPDGWRYHSPEEGNLVAPVLARVASVLAEHTASPDHGVVAVWEGWGGLTSGQSMGFLFMVKTPAWLPRWLQRPVLRFQQRRLEFLERRRRFGTASALRAFVGSIPLVRALPGSQFASAGSGILPREVVTGPKLELPARSYFCFEAGIRDFEGSNGVLWPLRAPWVEDPASWWIQSPNLIWPDGHEWMLLSEIDFDSTLIACSRACADALLTTDGIEAVAISRDTQLWS
ncbi:MAG: hypothetical protein ACTIJ6_08245 [Leucobacter sp.]